MKVLDSNAAVNILLLGPPLKYQDEHTETKKGSLTVDFAELKVYLQSQHSSDVLFFTFIRDIFC